MIFWALEFLLLGRSFPFGIDIQEISQPAGIPQEDIIRKLLQLRVARALESIRGKVLEFITLDDYMKVLVQTDAATFFELVAASINKPIP